MGQYWKGIILKENWKKVKNLVEFSCSSWEFSVGAKLLEHSWIGNHYLDMYIQLLATKYYGYPFVWCGDYCDHMKTSAYKNMEVRVTSRLIEPRKETEILSDDETPEVFNKVIEALEKYIGKDWLCLSTVQENGNLIPCLSCVLIQTTEAAETFTRKLTMRAIQRTMATIRWDFGLTTTSASPTIKQPSRGSKSSSQNSSVIGDMFYGGKITSTRLSTP